MNSQRPKRELFPELAPPGETEGRLCGHDRPCSMKTRLVALRRAAGSALALATSRDGIVVIAEGLMVIAGFAVLAQAL